jgi:hypothetical protein
MARKALVVAALSTIVAVSPALAQAPAGSPQTRYCLRVEPVTGSHIPGVACLTRDEWADGNIDVDQVWAEDGVGVEN